MNASFVGIFYVLALNYLIISKDHCVKDLEINRERDQYETSIDFNL